MSLDARTEAAISRLEAARVDPPEQREEEDLELCDGCPGPRSLRCCYHENEWYDEGLS